MSRWNPLHTPALGMRLKTLKVKYLLPRRGAVSHVFIDATGLKVDDEGN